MPLLGPLGNVAQFVKNPLGYVGRLFASYGPIAALVQGKPTRLVSTEQNVPGTVFVLGPELNRTLFSNHDLFHKCALSGPLYPRDPSRERTRPLTRLLTGLFHVNGEEHRRQRRLIMPAFHKSRVDRYRDDMVAIAETVLDQFAVGQVRDLRPDLMELTLRIATKTLFGADLGQAGVEIGRGLQLWLRLFRPSAVLPLDVPGLPYRRWLELSRSLDERMRRLIADKRQSGTDGGDVLSMLLQARDEGGDELTEDELIGHAGVIFAAGHETSSNALCWTLLLLSQHPAAASAVAAELREVLGGAPPCVDQLPELPELDRVIRESLRLFPPAPLNHRLAASDCELGGYRLRAGTEVISSIYHTHRLPEIYADPQRFRPERWQGFEPGPYAFSPFSAGPRACIGASFAMMEMKIVLAMLLQRFRLELAPGCRIDPAITITMSPKYGLPMILHPADGRFHDNRRGLRGKVCAMVDLDSS